MRSVCFVFDWSLYNWYLRIFSADHLRQAWSWPRTIEIHNQSAGDGLNSSFPHENARKRLKRCHTPNAHALSIWACNLCFSATPWKRLALTSDVSVFTAFTKIYVYGRPHEDASTAFSNLFTLESVFEFMRLRWALSPSSCERKA